MNKDVHDLVLSVLGEALPEDVRLKPTTRFADLSFESLALFEVVYALEDRLSITLDIGAIESLEYVGGLTAAISRHLQPLRFTVA